MIKNFIKTTLRSFKKNISFSLINILGLAIGISCSVLIFVFVRYELSYDRFYKNSDRIFRIAQKGLIRNSPLNQTGCPGPLPEALYNDYPEVESVTRIYNLGRQTIAYNENTFIESRVQAVDSTFFDIFSMPFIKGSSNGALNKPNTVVITESIAKKYFGNEDPISKSIRLDDQELMVKGVIVDFPSNSHFHFDFLISIITFNGIYNDNRWGYNNYAEYFLLQKEYNYKDLEAKMPDLVNKYIFEGKYEELSKKNNVTWNIYFQPLIDIHLNSDIRGEFEVNGRKSYIYIFLVVALFILLIACVNFMNLNTAKSAYRSREVGVRKVVGAKKSSLISQFLGESITTSLIALIFGMAIAETFLPSFGNLMGRQLEIHYFNNFVVLPSLVLLALVLGIISGSYPAFFLSSFKPINVFKEKLNSGSRVPWLRNSLVVFQFTISIVLISSTVLVYRQLMYLQNEKLGFDKEQVIVLRNPFALNGKVDAFKKELLKSAEITNVSASTTLPGRSFPNWGCHTSDDTKFTLNFLSCDPNLIDVLKLEMVKGRFFSKDSPSDSTAIIINEAAVSLLEWKDPIGKIIQNNSPKPFNFKVIGVVKDFYYESKHQKVMPMAFAFLHGVNKSSERFISLRVKNANYAENIKFIDNSWRKFSNGIPIEYTFFNEDYDSLYRNEKQTRQIFVVFSILAIFIACIGLLGLSSYMAEQRTKEIGIRKVMGATVYKITFILSASFTKWVLLSNLLAWPIAYILMTKWLQNFAYKVSISWWMFIVAAVLSMLIAIITISYQSIKAATRNPVDSLRYE